MRRTIEVGQVLCQEVPIKKKPIAEDCNAKTTAAASTFVSSDESAILKLQLELSLSRAKLALADQEAKNLMPKIVLHECKEWKQEVAVTSNGWQSSHSPNPLRSSQMTICAGKRTIV